MTERANKIPGPDHPITIGANTRPRSRRPWQQAIADTTRALTLHEANYPPGPLHPAQRRRYVVA